MHSTLYCTSFFQMHKYFKVHCVRCITDEDFPFSVPLVSSVYPCGWVPVLLSYFFSYLSVWFSAAQVLHCKQVQY